MNLTKLTCAGLLLLTIAASLASEAAAEVRWQTDTAAAVAKMQQQQRPLLAYFTADYCHWCKRLDHDTWSEPAVAGMIHKAFVPLKVDAQKSPELLKALQISGLPAVVAISSDGRVIGRVSGYRNAEDMLRELQNLKSQTSLVNR